MQVLKNPLAGRKLFKLLKFAGLEDVEIDPILWSWTDFNQWRPHAFDLAIPIGLKMGAWTQQEADEFENDLQQLHDQGAFYACVGYNLTAGRKPG